MVWTKLLNLSHKEGTVESAKKCNNCHAIIVVPHTYQSRLQRFWKYVKIAWNDSEVKPDNYYELVRGSTHG